MPPKILGYTRLNDVDAGGTSPNYCVTSLWVPNGDSYTLSFDAAYGHTTGSGKCVTYVAPYDAGTGSDTITITLIDNKTGLSASVTDTFTVNPIPSRP